MGEDQKRSARGPGEGAAQGAAGGLAEAILAFKEKNCKNCEIYWALGTLNCSAYKTFEKNLRQKKRQGTICKSCRPRPVI